MLELSEALGQKLVSHFIAEGAVVIKADNLRRIDEFIAEIGSHDLPVKEPLPWMRA